MQCTNHSGVHTCASVNKDGWKKTRIKKASMLNKHRILFMQTQKLEEKIISEQVKSKIHK